MTQNLTAEKMDEFSQTETAAEKKPKSGAFLVGVTEQGELPQDAREHLDELRELVSTLGFPVVGEMMTVIRVPNVKFYLGSGKAEEVCNAAKQAGAELIVFDTELGPSQQRNLERLARTNVVDRQEIILDIFAERAQTREAVLQVELARNKYFLPRLTRGVIFPVSAAERKEHAARGRSRSNMTAAWSNSAFPSWKWNLRRSAGSGMCSGKGVSGGRCRLRRSSVTPMRGNLLC